MEINVSSNVTVFAGHQQVELVSSIIKSTASSTSTTSPPSTADVAVVSPMVTVPYQAIVSGSKVTVFVLSSSTETQQLVLSPSMAASSSSKLQPLLQLSIDHPLCTVTAKNGDIQYNISCYDAHVNLAVGGKSYSSEG